MAATSNRRVLLAALAVLAFALGAFNFLSLLAEEAQLGGGALAGYQSDGHYFVGSHGSYREVTPEQWEHSRLHGLSVFVTHPLAMAGMAYLLFSFVFPAAIGQARPKTAQRVNTVRESGPMIASTSCGGRLGLVSYSAGLTVSAHPAGIVIKPIFMAPRAILKEEMLGLESRRGVLSHSVSIRHSAPDLASPLLLYVAENDALAEAIGAMALAGK